MNVPFNVPFVARTGRDIEFSAAMVEQHQPPNRGAPEFILMMDRHFREVVKHLDAIDKASVASIMVAIPLETFPDKLAMMDRAVELAKQGKRVMVCE